MIKFLATAALSGSGPGFVGHCGRLLERQEGLRSAAILVGRVHPGGFVGGAWGGDVSATEAVSQGGAFAAGTPYNSPFGAAYGYDVDHSFIGGGPSAAISDAAGTPFLFGIEGEDWQHQAARVSHRSQQRGHLQPPIPAIRHASARHAIRQRSPGCVLQRRRRCAASHSRHSLIAAEAAGLGCTPISAIRNARRGGVPAARPARSASFP